MAPSGRKKTSTRGLQAGIRTLSLPRVSTWENRYADRDTIVRIEIPEFTCLCPKTGLPDFALITLRYVPDQSCLELKSLKAYVHAFRNLGIFHENAANRILDDLWAACRPRALSVEGVFNPRGGITTTVRSELGNADLLIQPPRRQGAKNLQP